MFFIIGTKFLSWGSQTTNQPMRCTQCQIVAPFTEKTGMNFVTLFFVIPIIPISGKKNLIECPNCKAKFEMN